MYYQEILSFKYREIINIYDNGTYHDDNEIVEPCILDKEVDIIKTINMYEHNLRCSRLRTYFYESEIRFWNTVLNGMSDSTICDYVCIISMFHIKHIRNMPTDTYFTFV